MVWKDIKKSIGKRLHICAFLQENIYKTETFDVRKKNPLSEKTLISVVLIKDFSTLLPVCRFFFSRTQSKSLRLTKVVIALSVLQYHINVHSKFAYSSKVCGDVRIRVSLYWSSFLPHWVVKISVGKPSLRQVIKSISFDT